ncbi:General amino acid permease AGP3 [Wickerhamiella sorbophila]|uniref:General amino acid permease AGP3 n=1 Tax=Wickerhamiella sorbophila TaxID=45607 RepID=A0A2T0FL37_9ASCO|nr:General amino acid permease AGP3 [Wickerhamiella sorbophila]PRT55690.1 General amino acid permease AGP3 [Wickerhamiella sorbophila]
MQEFKESHTGNDKEPNNLVTEEVASDDLSADNVGGNIDPDSGVKRGLKNRHISMMALAGIIGPGLLVGAGRALANGGPASLIIGFGVIGVIAFSIMQSLGEVTTLYPSGGGFITLGARFINPAFGFVVGWNYFIVWIAVLANEYNAISSVLYSWSDKVPIYGYFLLFWTAFGAFQMLGVAAFGESEFWLALIKLLGLAAFFIFAIVYAAGGVSSHPAFGFHYWNDPGAFSNGFRGVATVFVFCSTFYAGVESVALTATESRNPSKAIPNAIRQVLWRIVFVYMGSAITFGMTCPWDDPLLKGGATKALQSPMTCAIQHAGWAGGHNLINAFILVTCLSAINSSIYIGSRTVLHLAHMGCAPKIFKYTTKSGVPVYAIIFTNLFGFLSLMNISTGAAEAYNYIVNLSGVSTFIVWAGIAFTAARFRSAWIRQGHTVEELPYRFRLNPFNSYFGFCVNIFLAFVQGWSVFSPFDAGNFVDSYILLPVSVLGYLGFAWWTKQFKWFQLEEIDLNTGRRRDLDGLSEEQTLDTEAEPEDKPPAGLKHRVKKLWSGS